MNDPENSPFTGDEVIKQLGPELGAFVAESDELSELVIAPFVDTAAIDLDSLDPEVKQAILESKARAEVAWEEFAALEEEERLALGLSLEEWEERRSQNLKDTLAAYILKNE